MINVKNWRNWFITKAIVYVLLAIIVVYWYVFLIVSLVALSVFYVIIRSITLFKENKTIGGEEKWWC